MMQPIEKLASSLVEVNGSYPHFVEVTMAFAEEYGIAKQLVDYIERRQDATASDVIKERTRLVHGVVL